MFVSWVEPSTLPILKVADVGDIYDGVAIHLLPALLTVVGLTFDVRVGGIEVLDLEVPDLKVAIGFVEGGGEEAEFQGMLLEGVELAGADNAAARFVPLVEGDLPYALGNLVCDLVVIGAGQLHVLGKASGEGLGDSFVGQVGEYGVHNSYYVLSISFRVSVVLCCRGDYSADWSKSQVNFASFFIVPIIIHASSCEAVFILIKF